MRGSLVCRYTNVIGNVTGNVIGNVTGNVIGNVTGNVSHLVDLMPIKTARIDTSLFDAFSSNLSLPVVTFGLSLLIEKRLRSFFI